MDAYNPLCIIQQQHVFKQFKTFTCIRYINYCALLIARMPAGEKSVRANFPLQNEIYNHNKFNTKQQGNRFLCSIRI